MMEPVGTAAGRLLIVDDEEINRLILSNLFEGIYEVDEAADGREALDKIEADPARYIAVLLDVMMPVLDGIEVLKRLAPAGYMERVPVFLITAERGNAVMEEAYSLGVMDFIGKPIVPYAVIKRVQSVVELFEARKRLSLTVEDQRLQLLERAEQIIELNRGMIESLSAAIEFRDGESGDHVQRIHDITKLMLTQTHLGEGLSSEDIDDIALAAIMHDVGKIAIPDAILCKPGRLTPEEFEIMKTHTVQGAELLARIPQMRGTGAYRYAIDIARHHHERWDGRGYPDGLAGDQISIWAQVVSLADVYDALTNKRVYKAAFTREESLRMIRDGECGTFNPELLACFFEVEPQICTLYERGAAAGPVTDGSAADGQPTGR
ncbi:HD-GYP domain-containing protein [Collinsella tanakaei]|uniref:HD-GYP domain-containing protein n=1 Tax=Collinsella tanakaei TaxID=626935 RepID=UPI0025A40110|nr:HD domain-containing phosphohydrolase [Collinsella tanakaei]MDM8301068.1 response regulator [Collinsella tanakaei]